MRSHTRIAALLGVSAAAACAEPGSLAGPDDLPVAPGAPTDAVADAAYFPPPDAAGGWRRLVAANATPTAQQKADIRAIAGLDWDVLKKAWDGSSQYGGSFIVIRHGYIAAERGTTGSMAAASCTKTFTSLGIHRLFQMSANGGLGTSIDPESFATSISPRHGGTTPPGAPSGSDIC